MNLQIPEDQRLTHFMKRPYTERTSNKLENYYKQRDPTKYKKIYKTITEMLSYLIQE